MTYGPPVITAAAGDYVYTSSVISAGAYAATVRQLVDPAQIRVTNELSEVYYRRWKYGLPYLYGDWDVCPTYEQTKQQFNLLCGLVQTMGRIAFHYVNVDMGTPVPLETYWLEDITIRYHPDYSFTTEENPPVSSSSDGYPLGPEEYVELGPVFLAQLDDIEAQLGQSTRGIRDYYISIVLADTGVDLTGVF